MQIYEVRISHAAFQDMAELRSFLDAMLSEEAFVIVDRILPAKMNKGR